MYYFTICMNVADIPSHTSSRLIEDAAMRDERGDDVPDNESNEWEVERELVCSSRSRYVLAVSSTRARARNSLDIYSYTYVCVSVCRWSGVGISR